MSATTACVICGDPTTSAQQAAIGGESGPVCEDCAFWCDGNLIES